MGGYNIHSKNGVIDNLSLTEKEAMDESKLFLSYMPKSIYKLPPIIKSNKDSASRTDKSLINIIPKNKIKESYDMIPIIKSILDKIHFLK